MISPAKTRATETYMPRLSPAVRWRRRPKISPAELDLIRMQSASATHAATGGNPKALALAVGRAVATVRDWCSGSDTNPIYRAAVVARSSARPETLVVLMRVTALRAMLRTMPTAKLREEKEDILRRRMPLAASRASVAAMAEERDDDEISAAYAEVAALAERLVAIQEELASPERR